MGPRRHLRFLSVALAPAALFLLGCDGSNSDVDNDAPARTAASFRIDPSAATVDEDTGVLVFSVVGGEPPFTWTASDAVLGAVTPPNGRARDVNYRPAAGTAEGVNTLRVTDSRGNAASATVVH